MEANYIELRKCPYCGKELAVELKPFGLKVMLKKDFRMPEPELEYKRIYEKLKQRGLLDKGTKKERIAKVSLIKAAMAEMAEKYKAGIPYAKIKAVAQKHKISNENDMRMTLEILKRIGDIYEPIEDVYKVIELRRSKWELLCGKGNARIAAKSLRLSRALSIQR